MLDREAIQHRTAEVEGLSVFYREAGEPTSPKLLLLGGFPASSHQFRNLIPALADRFHVVCPTIPGFGNTDMPDPRLRLHVRPPLGDRRGPARDDRASPARWALHAGLRRTRRQPDHRPPPGLARVAGHPELERLRGGLHRLPGTRIRHALWVDRIAETEAPLAAVPRARRREARLHPRASRSRADQPRQLEHGRPLPRAPERASASSSTCFYDYRTNVELYPAWQAFLRERQPETLILWGAERHLLHPRGWRGLPARPAERRAASGSTRGTSRSRTSSTRSPRRSCASTPSGSMAPGHDDSRAGPGAPDAGALGQRRPSARGLRERQAGHDRDLEGAGRRSACRSAGSTSTATIRPTAGPRRPGQGRLRLPVRVLRALAKRAAGARRSPGARSART